MAKNTAQISCTITKQLHDRIAHLDHQAETLRTALQDFLHNQPQNPITRDVLIKLRDQRIYVTRNRQLTFNVPKTIRDEAKALATQEGLTLSAILRRSIYEYTKPQDEYADSNLLPMYDGWGDVA